MRVFKLKKTLTLFFLNSLRVEYKEYTFYFLYSIFAGGYREVAIPSPIPNLEVKHFIADNTAGSPCGNVGRCQLLSFYLQSLA